MSDVSDILEFRRQQNLSAQTSFVGNLDADPDETAKAVNYGREAGVDPSYIAPNVDQYEQEFKSRLGQEIIRGNPVIQDYINAHPLNAAMVQDDLGNLDNTSQAIHSYKQIGYNAVKAGLGAFVDSLSQPWELEPADPKVTEFAKEHPIITKAVENLPTGPSQVPLKAGVQALNVANMGIQRVTSAALDALEASATKALGHAGGREIRGWAEMLMMQEVGNIHLPEGPQAEIANSAKVSAPWLMKGELPPVGVFENLDAVHRQLAIDTLAKLDDVTKAGDKANLRERSPQEFSNFLQGQLEGGTIGVRAEAIRKLYGDKVPSPDDNVLGWHDGIAEQLAHAESYGGNVNIPLADWIAKADPEVRKALKDDVQLNAGGMTVADGKDAPLADAPQRMPPIDTLDAVRRASATESVFGNQGLSLRRQSKEDSFYDSFSLHDSTGNEIGRMSIHEEPTKKELEILDIEGGAKAERGQIKGIPNVFGVGPMLRLLRQLQNEYPNAEWVSGLRVSGARFAAKGKEGIQNVRIRLRPSKQEIDTIADRMGWEESITGLNEPQVNMIPANAKPDTLQHLRGVTAPSQSFTFKDIAPNLDFSGWSEGSTRDLVQFIRRRMLDTLGDVKIHVISDEDMDKKIRTERKGTPAFYNPVTHEVVIARSYIDGTWGPKYGSYLIQHEMAHAFSVLQAENFPGVKNAIIGLMNAAIDTIKGTVKSERREKFGDIDYGFTDWREFVAEAFSNGDFQKFLSGIKLSPELMEKLEIEQPYNTLWEAFKNRLKKLWTAALGRPVEDNLIDGMLRIGGALHEATREMGDAGLKDLGNRLWGDQMKAPLSGAKVPEQLEMTGVTRMEDREVFRKASDIGLTVKQYRQLVEGMDKQEREDMERLRAKAERVEKAKQTDQWKADEKRVRGEVTTALRNRPDIAVDEFLRSGTVFGEKLPGRPRLNSDRLSVEQKSGLPADYLRAGGIDPEDAANMFGYSSADEMLDAIRSLQAERGDRKPGDHFNTLVEGLTQARMRSEFGNLNENIIKEMEEHVISPGQLDRLHEEMVLIGSKEGLELPFTKADLKAGAKAAFDSVPTGSHDIKEYLAASGRAGRAAQAALLDKDFKGAFKLLQKQYMALLNGNMAKALAREQDRFEALAKRFRNPSITNIDQRTVAVIRDQLMRAGLQAGRSLQGIAEEIAERGGIRDMAMDAEAMQVPLMIPDWMYSAWQKKLDGMKTGEFIEFSKAMRQIYNYGIQEKKFNSQAESLVLGDFIKKANQQIQNSAAATGKAPKARRDEGLVGGAKHIVIGGLIQAESILNRFDLGNPRGAFNDIMFQAANGANGYSAAVKKYAAKIEEVGKLLKGMNLQKRLPDLLTSTIDGMPIKMTVEKAIRVIMDHGNISNRDKFSRGWQIDPARVHMWMAQNTTKEMWDFAQKLGDIHAEMFDELKEMIRQQSGGVVPDSIELYPFTDPHGVRRQGWYSPMIYDRVEQQSAKALNIQVDPNDPTGLTNSGFFKNSTVTGAEIRRTGYAGPTDLSLDRLPTKMNQILYDTAFRPFVINFGKLMRDSSFKAAITRNYGAAVTNMLQKWLQDIIDHGRGGGSDSDAMLAKAVEYMRGNIVGQLIGWNIHTVEKHGLSALINSMSEVGIGPQLRETLNLWRSSPDLMQSNWRFMLEKSQEMQRRMQHWQETTGGQFETLQLGRQGWRQWMLELGAKPVAISDMISAGPMWLAQYKESMAQLAKERPTDMPDTYEGIAISQADRVVRRAHGSTALTSRPNFMRGTGGKIFTSLYSFFNQMLQRNYEMMWRTQYAKQNFKEGEYARGLDNMKRAGVLLFTSVIWPALVEELVTPYTNSDRDSWGVLIGKSLLNGASATIPIAREIVHGIINAGETGVGVLDTGFKEMASTVSDLRRGANMLDAEHGGKTLKDINAMIGVAVGRTNNEVGNVLKTIWDSVHRSRQTPWNPAELYRDVTTGRPMGAPDVIQRAVVEPLTQRGRRR